MKKTYFSLFFSLLLFALLSATKAQTSGGPDAFGYVWRNSDDSLGPVFNWIDLDTKTNATDVTPLLGDDNIIPSPYNILMTNFQYYGSSPQNLWIGSNGFIAFSSGLGIASPFPNIPYTGGQNNYVAPMGCDLVFKVNSQPIAGAECKLWTSPDLDSLVVMYKNVPFWDPNPPGYTGSNTFEVILSALDNSITFQYLTQSGFYYQPLEFMTIGIENDPGNDGLPYLYDVYPKPGTAVKYSYSSIILYNIVKGLCFVDYNHNSIKDSGEPGYSKATVVSTSNNGTRTTLSDGVGNFRNYILDTGNVVTSITNVKHYSIAPLQHVSNFSSPYNTDSVNFALFPEPNIQDLRIDIIPVNPLRINGLAYYRLQYSNVGTDTMSGAIFMIKDPRTSFVSSMPAQTSTSGDTIGWSYVNLLPNETRTIEVTLQVSITVNIGDLLNTVAVIEPVATDTIPADNRACVCEQPVVGSFDPNDKAMLGGSNFTTAQVTDSEYMSYMVRFQNTGNDTAFTVIIRDTLDNKLDGGTLEMVSSSHPCRLAMLNEKYISWTFDNILLPDSNVDEPNSHGYVAYRIRPKSTVVTNDEIRNTAYIYFDYNSPVKTNTVVTTITESVITGVNDIAHDGLVVYPNPSTGEFTVYGLPFGVTATLEIFNVIGERVHEGTLNRKHQTVKCKLPEGIYFLQVRDGQEVITKKVVVR